MPLCCTAKRESKAMFTRIASAVPALAPVSIDLGTIMLPTKPIAYTMAPRKQV